MNSVANGRLTLTSNTPVTTADVTAAGVLYYTPHRGNKIALYSSPAWKLHTFSERSLALSITSGSNYDVFLYDNSGTLTLELSAAWTNDTTRNEALAIQDGIYVKSGATTRRYLGTLRASGANVTEDSAANRYLWNMYNRVSKPFYKSDALTSWSYSTNSWRASNNNTANRVQLVNGIVGGMLRLGFDQLITTNSGVYQGICEDCSNNYTAGHYGNVQQSTQFSVAQLNKIPDMGYHYYQMVELGNGTTIFYCNGNCYFFGVWES